MARNRDTSEDDQWLSQIRGGQPDTAPSAEGALPPDPWLDGPVSSRGGPSAAPDPWADGPRADDDPWAPRPVVPPVPMPSPAPHDRPPVPTPRVTPPGTPPVPMPAPAHPSPVQQPRVQQAPVEQAPLAPSPQTGPTPWPASSTEASANDRVIPQQRGPELSAPIPPPSRIDAPTAPPPPAPGPPPDLSQSLLVKERKGEPESGWRRVVYKASFGGINPGRSPEEVERDALIARIRTPIRGCHKIAVVSLKGGIGKTTTTSCLGLTLAHYRGDRVVALDANPDAGTLAERLTGPPDVSVRDLLDDIDKVESFTDISRYMSLAERLQVLASDQDPEVSEAFDSEQYTAVTSLLGRYYNVILTDSGTGMLHSAMDGTLQAANSLVVVGAPSVDGSSRASKTLDWLNAHGYDELVRNAVAVISSVRPKTESVDMNVLRNHFAARCRAVVEIPYDQHLVVGGRIEMSRIARETERAYLELAAAVADGFSIAAR